MYENGVATIDRLAVDATLGVDEHLAVTGVGAHGVPIFGDIPQLPVALRSLLPELERHDFGLGRRKDEEMLARPVETTAIRCDGSTFLAEVTIDRKAASAGEDTFVCHVTDLSVLTPTELTLRRKLRRAELVLSAVTDGIFSVDAAGIIDSANPSAAAMLRRRRIDLLGQRLEDVIGHAQASGAPFDAAISPIALTLHDGVTRRAADSTLMQRGGSRIDVDFSCSAVHEGGTITGGVVTVNDVTERRAIERRKDEFLSVVSHELRTPLTSIRGSLGLIAGGVCGPLTAPVAEMIGIAMANSQRLSRLVSDLLDLERLATGRMPLHMADLDVAELVSEVARQQLPAALHAGVELCVDVTPAIATGDEHHLTTAIVNLLSNAIKFSEPGGTVVLTTGYGADTTWIRVKDHGRGIPANLKGHIFERFSQVDASDATTKGGAGLGLSITAHIVAALGGSVDVESEPGAGSVFSILLPRDAARREVPI
jgi:PAS domain S-box-containing protein